MASTGQLKKFTIRKFHLWLSKAYSMSAHSMISTHLTKPSFAPEEETVNSIKDWLLEFGIHDSRIVHSDNKGWIAVDVTVSEAEALLDTEYYEHEHTTSSKVRVGCDEYVPGNVITT